MHLTTPRLLLREFRDDDFPAVWDYQQRAETHRYETEVIPSPDAVRQMIRDIQAKAQESPRTFYRLGVTVPPDDGLIGHVKLALLRLEAREWEIGWAIHPDHWGKGYASEAARAMLDFAFHQVGAHRVIAFCNANNAASARVMEKLGMVRDGHLRESIWWNGGWSDEFVYAILDREWA